MNQEPIEPSPLRNMSSSMELQAATLVVIDDDPFILRATARIVANAGYKVVTGGTAAEAVELTRRHVPAMLLLDVMLPDGNGMDVARQLKSDPALAEVFVVLLSGMKTSSEDQATGLSGGLADGYIVRPFGKTELLARIAALLRLRAAQVELRVALHDKEALLKEAHHRVKNNLQLIASLLRIGSAKSTQPETKTLMKEMQSRIRSVAMLHETLYRTGNYIRVNLSNYLRELATLVFKAQNAGEGTVRLALMLESVEVGTDQAIPCGLIVNELITNALKYAFPDERQGQLRVELGRVPDSNAVRLVVADDGVGLPPDLEDRTRNSLGTQLVYDLVRQLGATLTIGSGPGCRFEIVFEPKASRAQTKSINSPPDQ